MDTLDHFLSIKDIITIDPDDNYCTNKPGFVNFLKKSHGIFLMQVTQNTITLNIASGAELEEIRTPLGLEKLRALVGIGINLLYTIEADETLTLSNYETFYSRIIGSCFVDSVCGVLPDGF